MELLGDGDLMWSPLRTSSAESTLSTSSNSGNSTNLWQDGAPNNNKSAISHRGSPVPEFERVAALASTSTTDLLLPRGFSNVSSVSTLGRSTSLDLNGLLGCDLTAMNATFTAMGLSAGLESSGFDSVNTSAISLGGVGMEDVRGGEPTENVALDVGVVDGDAGVSGESDDWGTGSWTVVDPTGDPDGSVMG